MAAASFATLTSCTTPVKKENLISPAKVHSPQTLSSQILIERGLGTYKIKAEINIINDHAVRFDLLTSMDLPLSSIVMTDTSIEYVLYRDKKYYSGKPNPHALDPVFPIAIDVKHIIKLLNEESNTEDKCDSDQYGLTMCTGLSGSTPYIITWSKRKDSGPLAGRASKVSLEIPQRQISLKFLYTDWQKENSDAERLLALKIPDGYRHLSVPER